MESVYLLEHILHVVGKVASAYFLHEESAELGGLLFGGVFLVVFVHQYTQLFIAFVELFGLVFSQGIVCHHREAFLGFVCQPFNVTAHVAAARGKRQCCQSYADDEYSFLHFVSVLNRVGESPCVSLNLKWLFYKIFCKITIIIQYDKILFAVFRFKKTNCHYWSIMKHHTYYPQGTCSVQIDFDIDENGCIHNVSFFGGCTGNLQGIGRLVEGMPAGEVADKLGGVRCGLNETSCPDQLARAIRDYNSISSMNL